jgi:glycerol-3-phosphate dehydrogenase (NAD(P)+)
MIGLIGAGGWGTALAKICAQKGMPVSIWAREPEVVAEINGKHTNSTFLPGITIPESVHATTSLAEVISGNRFIFFTVPSKWLRSVARETGAYIRDNTVIISATKGLEVETLKMMNTVLEEELPMVDPNAIVALSGPTHAEEVAANYPSLIVVSTPVLKYAEAVQDLLISPTFRVYTNPDRIGVQLGGALKNVIALAAGISEGLGLGDNSKAALVTRGLAEMSRLGAAMGAQTPTFAGLSGMGDLFVTAFSKHSRNSWAGRELGKGRSLEDIVNSTKMVVEGVTTTRAAYQLARSLNVELPITFITHQILHEGVAPRDGVGHLMERVRTHEMEEVVTATYTWI